MIMVISIALLIPLVVFGQSIDNFDSEPDSGYWIHEISENADTALSYVDISYITDPVFEGAGAMQLDYSAHNSEAWGGYAKIYHMSSTASEEAPVLAGTWQMAPEAGALMVGPAPNDGSWWSNSEEDVVTRACYFDDKYEINGDGSFNNVLGDETWLETWQGVEYDQCGAPVYPHDGSNDAGWEYDAGAGTITLNGMGAYFGLPKANNQGELPNVDVPDSIVYNVTMSDNDSTMTLVIECGSGVFWTFKLVVPGYEPDLCPPSDLMAEAGDTEVFLNWSAPGMLGAIPTTEGLDLPETQKAHLPKGVTKPESSRECENWNDAWYYLWWGNNTIGQAALFSLDAGTYSLESVSIADYSNTYLGLTEATATVNVDVANEDGSTASTIATGTLVTDGSTGTLFLDGTSFELAATTFIKVSVYPATDLGVDYTGDGVNDFAPLLLSEDGTAGDGYCGTDSAGVYTAGVYDWDIEFCASGGGGGNECGTFSHYNVFMGGEQVGETDIEEFVVTGLENDMEYCFNVTTVYAEGESEASNDACATPMAPSMSVSTDAISDTLMPGESSGHEFVIENTGGWSFDYVVTVSSSGVRGLLSIEIMTDNYPSETTWDLQDGDGNVIESGGPLADPATLYQWDLELTGGDYLWTIYDAYGDGICCAYGEGWYNLFVDGEPAGSGGEFGSSESVDLSIGEGGGGVDWLSLSAESGALDPGEADEIEVLMNSGDLEEGTYDAYIVVSTYFSEHVIAVQMVVDDGVGIADGGAIPDVFALHQNFPNPFNPVTALPYDVPEIADVKIDIYNLLGQKVRSLVTGEHEPGFYRATWNGKNDRGALVTTGVYIYQITARSNATGEVAFTETRKLVLMK